VSFVLRLKCGTLLRDFDLKSSRAGAAPVECSKEGTESHKTAEEDGLRARVHGERPGYRGICWTNDHRVNGAENTDGQECERHALEPMMASTAVRFFRRRALSKPLCSSTPPMTNLLILKG